MLYNFIFKNLFLISVFFVFLFFLFILEIKNILQSKNIINTSKVIDLINHENALLLDIREESSYKDVHLLNSINLPFLRLEKDYIKLKKYKLKTIILIYSNFNLALRAVNFLKKNNFERVFLIENGIDSWLKSDLPVKRGKNEN